MSTLKSRSEVNTFFAKTTAAARQCCLQFPREVKPLSMNEYVYLRATRVKIEPIVQYQCIELDVKFGLPFFPTLDGVGEPEYLWVMGDGEDESTATNTLAMVCFRFEGKYNNSSGYLNMLEHASVKLHLSMRSLREPSLNVLEEEIFPRLARCSGYYRFLLHFSNCIEKGQLKVKTYATECDPYWPWPLGADIPIKTVNSNKGAMPRPISLPQHVTIKCAMFEAPPTLPSHRNKEDCFDSCVRCLFDALPLEPLDAYSDDDHIPTIKRKRKEEERRKTPRKRMENQQPLKVLSLPSNDTILAWYELTGTASRRIIAMKTQTFKDYKIVPSLKEMSAFCVMALILERKSKTMTMGEVNGTLSSLSSLQDNHLSLEAVLPEAKGMLKTKCFPWHCYDPSLRPTKRLRTCCRFIDISFQFNYPRGRISNKIVHTRKSKIPITVHSPFRPTEEWYTIEESLDGAEVHSLQIKANFSACPTEKFLSQWEHSIIQHCLHPALNDHLTILERHYVPTSWHGKKKSLCPIKIHMIVGDQIVFHQIANLQDLPESSPLGIIFYVLRHVIQTKKHRWSSVH